MTSFIIWHTKLSHQLINNFTIGAFLTLNEDIMNETEPHLNINSHMRFALLVGSVELGQNFCSLYSSILG